MTPAKNRVCIWYARDAVEAACFYARTFPDSSVGSMHRAPGDNPSSKEGAVLTVEFTVLGIPCIGLNGGPGVEHNWAFSFQVATADQVDLKLINRREFSSGAVALRYEPTRQTNHLPL